MLYAALTFWLLVIMFSAWGVHRLWSGMIRPRVVNTVLLPGTLVAQLGHVLGLLVTGNSVRNTSLMGDDEAGEPQSDTPEQPRIPLIGPILTGLLPLLACAAALYVAAKMLGGGVMVGIASSGGVEVPQILPTSASGVWTLLRTNIDVMENMLNAIMMSDLTSGATLLFLYLAICLTVRMTPFEGNRRGAIGAIVLSGLTFGLLSLLFGGVENVVRSGWPVLSFAVGILLFLLLVSLVVSGIVGLARIIAKDE